MRILLKSRGVEVGLHVYYSASPTVDSLFTTEQFNFILMTTRQCLAFMTPCMSLGSFVLSCCLDSILGAGRLNPGQ